MNRDFIIESIDIINQIELGSTVAITKDDEELKYKLNYIDQYSYNEFELTCLDQDDTIWDSGETIDDIKQMLVCDVVRERIQKIRLI